ncbi:MAG: flavodoxin domain-containing protein [Pseudomonadota bacterium]
MNAFDPQMLKSLSAAAEGQSADGTLVPEDAPFDPAQRQWLNGLFAGINAVIGAMADANGQDAPGTALSILFGSQSGNCERLSKDLRKYAATQGFEAEIAPLNDVTPADLAGVNHALIVVSTFGEGEPPDNAAKFFKALMADDCPPLPETLNFSVIGLGDTSYADFNQCATDIDTRLGELGATRVADMVPCDVDFEEPFAEWKISVFNTDAFMTAASASAAPLAAEPEAVEPAFNKSRPFMASLMTADRLSGDASAKSVRHIEISLAGGGADLEYAAGDALGVMPLNCPEDVAAVLRAAGLTGKEPVTLKSGPAQLRAALMTQLDIAVVTPKTLEALGVDKDASGLEDDAQLLDVLNVCDGPVEAQTLVDAIRALQPRLYSISSSPKAHPGEVHLTVGEVRYTLNERSCKGVASTYLGDRLQPGAMVGVYVNRSPHFHPPSNDDLPLIMIGPGTGIAPFRAFLEEREARSAPGKNWLFFGDQHEACDFLYREQVEAWRTNGVLDRLDLAWSRDGSEKVYVQTLLEKHGEDVFAWLQEGAAIYICGDASRMAADVEKALLTIIAKGLDTDEVTAQAYLDDLADNHRYQRDVY